MVFSHSVKKTIQKKLRTFWFPENDFYYIFYLQKHLCKWLLLPVHEVLTDFSLAIWFVSMHYQSEAQYLSRLYHSIENFGEAGLPVPT